MPLSAGGGGLSRQPAVGLHLLEKHRLREIIALGVADLGGGLQVGELLEGFHAFCDHGHAERLAQRFDGAQHGLAARPLVDVRDEGTVDLDLVGGDFSQRGERRIAGAEIVDRHARAELAQLGQDLGLERALAQKRFFGHLDHEALGAVGCRQRLHEGVHERGVAGLLGGDVEADARIGAELGIDQIDRRHHLVEYQVCQFVDQPELDREVKEGGRCLDHAVLVVETDQRFDADDLPGADVDLGLEGAVEALFQDRKPQRLLQLGPRRRLAFHVAVEDREAALDLALDPVHGDVGVVAQHVVAAAVLGIEAGSDRGRGEDLEIVDEHRRLEALQEAVERGREFDFAYDRIEQQQEFVAADPRQHIGGAQFRLQPLGELDQQGIAGGMAVIIVDVLEIVDVEEHQREAAGGAVVRQDVVDPGFDHRPFRHAGQFVEIGAARQLFLGGLVPGEVDRGREQQRPVGDLHRPFGGQQHARAVGLGHIMLQDVRGGGRRRLRGELGFDARGVRRGQRLRRGFEVSGGGFVHQQEVALFVPHRQADREHADDLVHQLQFRPERGCPLCGTRGRVVRSGFGGG